MKCIELEFNNKVDLKALGFTEKELEEDLKLLDKYGFDFNRNILNYLHEIAEYLRYAKSED